MVEKGLTSRSALGISARGSTMYSYMRWARQRREEAGGEVGGDMFPC